MNPIGDCILDCTLYDEEYDARYYPPEDSYEDPMEADNQNAHVSQLPTDPPEKDPYLAVVVSRCCDTV
jgi:hypothetical protein